MTHPRSGKSGACEASAQKCLRFDPQLKQAGSVCRASAGQCDLAEYCTGASEECPEDSFEMNGKPCYNQAEGYCHDGQCPTHQHHCWRVFGPGNGSALPGTELQVSSGLCEGFLQARSSSSRRRRRTRPVF